MSEEKLYLNLRKSYPFDCYSCGYSQNANPSIIMQTFQSNLGGGSCLKCGIPLKLEIDNKNEKMISSSDSVTREFGPLPESCYATKDNVGKFI